MSLARLSSVTRFADADVQVCGFADAHVQVFVLVSMRRRDLLSAKHSFSRTVGPMCSAVLRRAYCSHPSLLSHGLFRVLTIQSARPALDKGVTASYVALCLPLRSRCQSFR